MQLEYQKNFSTSYIRAGKMDSGIGESHEKILIEDFDLTSAEARVALLLSDGFSVQQIAETLENTQGTVRQKLKLVFSKVGVNSQSQLVSMVLKHLM